MKRKKRNGPIKTCIGLIFKLISGVIICCSIFFAITIFFKVQNVVVVGDNPYEDTDVIEISEIKGGENSFLINKFIAIEKIMERCPYIDTVEIDRKLPSTLELNVKRCVPIAQIDHMGMTYIIDINGKILEEKPMQGDYGYILIEGVTANEMVVCEKIDFLQKEKQKTLINILLTAEKYDIIEQITSINMDKLYNLSFEYKKKFEVILGSGQDIDEKLRLLLAVEKELPDNESGIIDISDTENIGIR